MRFVFVLFVAAACGDNITTQSTSDAAPPTPPDAALDAAPAIGPCLDQPTDLLMPPPMTGVLPCELLPPGFGS
jgi:hypothetical protein